MRGPWIISLGGYWSLVLELSNRCRHDWLCIVGALDREPNAVIEVVGRAKAGWIYELVVAGWLIG